MRQQTRWEEEGRERSPNTTRTARPAAADTRVQSSCSSPPPLASPPVSVSPCEADGARGRRAAVPARSSSAVVRVVRQEARHQTAHTFHWPCPCAAHLLGVLHQFLHRAGDDLPSSSSSQNSRRMPTSPNFGKVPTAANEKESPATKMGQSPLSRCLAALQGP